MLRTLFKGTKDTSLSAPKPLSETPIGAIDDFISVMGSLFGRAGSVTEKVVLCFRVGGWWPVLGGLFQEMHRTSLNYLVLVTQLMGILS